MARPHGKPRKRVYRYKRPGKNLAAACKEAASFKVSPERESVRGFFFVSAAIDLDECHMTMWNDILNRIRRLQALDRNRAVFGADSHGYRLMDVITPDALARTEARLGVVLPDELRAFYTELGDGDCGPDWGLYRSDQLEGFNADREWPGIEALKAAEYSAHALAGVVAVMDRFYNFRSLIVCTGPMRGQVIAFEEGQFAFVESRSLIDVYRTWLEHEEQMLDGYIDLMLATTEIREVAARHLAANGNHPENSLVICASLLGIENYSLRRAHSAIRWNGDQGQSQFSIDVRTHNLFAERIAQEIDGLRRRD